MGKGAIIKALCKEFHPSTLIRNKFPNIQKGQRLKNMVVVRKEVKKIRRTDAMCKNDDNGGENIELYCLDR